MHMGNGELVWFQSTTYTISCNQCKRPKSTLLYAAKDKMTHTQKIHVAHDTPVIKCIYIDMWANKLFTKYTQWNIVNVCDLPIFNVWKYGISMSHLTILSLKHVASIAGETEIVFTQSLGLYSGCMQTNRQHTIFPQQRKTHRHIRTHTAQRIRGKE